MTARSRRVIIGLLILVVIGIAALALFPFLIASDSAAGQQLKAFFLHQLEQNIGRQIDVGDMHIKLFPKIHLELSDLTIHDVDPSRTFLTAKRADLVLRILPLFRREVVGKRLLIEEPQLHLRRNEHGHWNFLAPGTEAPDDDSSRGTPLPRLLLLREVTVANGALRITDSAHAETRTIEFESFDFAMLTQPTRRRAELYMSAIMPGAPTSSSLSLSGTVTQAHSQVQIAAADGPVFPTLQFDGSLEATNLQTRKVAYLLGIRVIPSTFGSAMNLRGRVRVVPGVVGYDMVLSDMSASIQQLALKGRASLSGLMTDQPTFALAFSSSRLALDRLLEIFPARWMHNELPAIIQQRKIRGAVEIVAATMTGMVMPEPKISLTGEFRIDGAHAVIDRKGTAIENVSGTVLVETGRVRVLELNGLYGPMRVAAGKASISFLEEGPMLDLDLKGEMAAAELIARVNPRRSFRSKNLVTAWNGLKDIRGVTSVAFRMTGPLNSPEKIDYVSAEFEPRDVSFRTTLLPEPVTGMTGRLLISEKGGEFDKLSGWIGQSLVQLQGRIVPDEKKAFQDFTITTRAAAADLLRLLPVGAELKTPPIGTVGAVVGLSGPLTAPRYRAVADLNDTTVKLPILGTKPRGRQASLEVDGGFTRGGAHLVHRAALVLPSARLTARGTARLDKRFRLNASVGFGPIAVTQLPDWMRPGGLDRGDIEVSVEVIGKEKDWRSWEITGWVAATNGIMSIKGLPAPVRDLNLRVKLIPNGAELKQFTFAVLDSDATITGVIRDWQTKPFLALSAESSRFDIDLLIPKRGRSPFRDFLERLAATSRLTGTASIKVGRYRMLTLSDLSCRVNITKEVVDIDRIVGQTTPGQIDGRVVINLPHDQPASGETALRIAGMAFEDLYPLFGNGESPVSGSLFLTASLRGHGKGPQGTAHTLGGRTDFRIAKGRIFKDDNRAIWKIISFLNVPAMLQGKVDLNRDGLPFDEITTSMTIENGKVATEKILVNSPVMKLSGAGSYSIPDDQLDYIVAVSPFGAYTSMLQSIPLFGKLLAGERQGLTTALFKVTGPLDDPEVEYLPMRSFAGGVGGFAKLAVDLLVNIVTLPKELVAPTKDEGPQVHEVPPLENAPSP